MNTILHIFMLWTVVGLFIATWAIYRYGFELDKLSDRQIYFLTFISGPFIWILEFIQLSWEWLVKSKRNN